MGDGHRRHDLLTVTQLATGVLMVCPKIGRPALVREKPPLSARAGCIGNLAFNWKLGRSSLGRAPGLPSRGAAKANEKMISG